MIALSARIHYAKNKHFKDHSQLLDYFRNALLPIVDSAHRYKFVIYLSWDEKVASDMIASILQIPPVTRCSALQIQIFGVYRRKKLPIEAISNWLNRRTSNVDKQKTKNPIISLRIHEGCIRRRSVRQMLDNLKEVRLFYSLSNVGRARLLYPRLTLNGGYLKKKKSSKIRKKIVEFQTFFALNQFNLNKGEN